MVWLPLASAAVANVATPEPFNVPAPIGLPASRNVTLPLGAPEPGGVAVSAAVKVTDWPNTAGLAVEASVVVEGFLWTTCGLPGSEPGLPLKLLAPISVVVIV